MSKFVEIASAEAGKEYGHVPGHQYHDVKVTIGRTGSKFRSKFRVQVMESWGSCQGLNNLEEAGNRRVVAIEGNLDAAVRIASSRAKEAQITAEYLVQALSCAHSDALDALADESVFSWVEPIFTPIQGRSHELSVSARDEDHGSRSSLGLLTFTGESFVFIPHDSRMVDEAAKRQVMQWVDDRRNDLLDLLISRINPDHDFEPLQRLREALIGAKK